MPRQEFEEISIINNITMENIPLEDHRLLCVQLNRKSYQRGLGIFPINLKKKKGRDVI